MIIQWVFFILLVVRLAVLVGQRRFNKNGGIKRVIGLYQSLFLGAFYTVISLLLRNNSPEIYIYIVGALSIPAAMIFRKKLFPYTKKCSNCDKSVKLFEILFIDDQKCDACKINH